MGKYTYAAMNVPAQVRLGQLETNLVRLRSMSGFLGGRYVMVNIPAAQIEAVENDRVVLRHTAIVGKIDRQTPILNSKINEIIVNPYWNAPESIVAQGHHSADAQGPDLPDQEQHPHLRRRRQRSRSDDDRLERPRTRRNSASARIRAPATPWPRSKINFPSPDGVYMHDTPQQSLFSKLMRFDSSGCVRVQNVRDLVDLAAARHARLGPPALRGRRSRPARTRRSQLADPVPVYFTYISAWSTGDGVVHFRDDIYGRDGVEELQLSQAL